MSFTETMDEETAALRATIREMPLNRELAEGSLPAETFRHYIVQDAHYLEGFARALALAAARAPEAEAVARLATAASGAIVVERQLHAHYMGMFGVAPEEFVATEPSAVCDHYVGFLLRTAALADAPEAVAALLPCFTVYLEVGHDIHARAAADNPYRAWIDTYAGEEFAEAVAGMVSLADALADGANPDARARMARAFRRSVWHEWAFWDGAYHRRRWQDPIRGTTAGVQPHSPSNRTPAVRV